MEISAAKSVEMSISYPASKKNETLQIENNNGLEKEKSQTKLADNSQDKKELTKDELLKMNYELNKFMELIDSDIKFIVHEKTQQLIVQVVNTKENKVLKEFPPSKMLDIMAGIREYVGVLLDKRV